LNNRSKYKIQILEVDFYYSDRFSLAFEYFSQR